MDQFIEAAFARVAQQVRQEAADAGQMMLGGFINALELLPADMPIRFDVGGAPSSPDSFRGYYEQLGFSAQDAATVGDVLAIAKAALGATFQGYKGGDYRMNVHTLIWKAEYGTSCDARRIVGITRDRDQAVIATSPDE